MWPARATVGRQPSRCVFGTDPWRIFMTAVPNRLRVDQARLFTNVPWLSDWFHQRKPAGAARTKLDDALAQLCFEKPCEPYSRTVAAVAHVLLEAIEDRLPVWA